MSETWPISGDEGIDVGDSGPTIVVENLRHEDFVRFAGATGDFNPMHYDDTYARDAGFRSAFGPGMLTASYGARMVSKWFGLGSIDRIKFRFTDKVCPGDTLTVEGTVDEVDDTPDGMTVRVSFDVRNRRDVVVLEGECDAIVGGSHE
ncbi:hypothetical protein GJR96_15720 [Haloferax sp. MBLA0076]|uniref:MaoC-like domain-containing protein n=1 Tax=Haloferax litoreum TaxID=2666140 RepID=A0A6A8GND4_9EURY|nr:MULTISPECIES: MaoC family dehydratase [Haloferax]KAB1190426.1 MaoC family dehydratase [Haloferax sp. CBA1148]MRX23400.1 hypothetical protein [Haloferax litoreum]